MILAILHERRRRRVIEGMLNDLMAEIPDSGPKTDDQLVIEAYLWRQLGEPVLASIIEGARSIHGAS